MKTRVARVALLAATLVSCGVAPSRAAQRPAQRVRGGVSLLLAVKADGPRAEAVVRRAAAVMLRRCDALRIRCELRLGARGQANRILLRFSPATDAPRVKRVLLARGLELRAVVSPSYPYPVRQYPTRAGAEAEAGDDADVLSLDDFSADTFVVVERAAIITGDDVRDCYAAHRGTHGLSETYDVVCRLRPAGAARMKAWTGANINRYVAVVFNGRVVAAPFIRAPIWYDVAVTGNFDRQRAEEVALVLSSGTLPAPVELIEEESDAV